MTQPAVILAHARSGSTFLAHCLDSHPDVFCLKTEPLHNAQPLRHRFPGASSEAILEALLFQPHYTAACAKIIYPHQTSDALLQTLRGWETRVILLTREDLLRTAVSWAFTSMRESGGLDRPVHSRSVEKPVRVRVDPWVVLGYAQLVRDATRFIVTALDWYHFQVLELSYEEVFGGEHGEIRELPTDVNRQICKFLGVDARYRMRSQLRKINRYPLKEQIENWGEFSAALKNTFLAPYLEE